MKFYMLNVLPMCGYLVPQYKGNGSGEYIFKVFSIISLNFFFFSTKEITIACKHDYPIDSEEEMLEVFFLCRYKDMSEKAIII